MWVVQQALKQAWRDRSCSSSMEDSIQACFVWRAVSCIHRKPSYWKQIFSDGWSEPKPSWKHSQMLQSAHRKGRRNCGRGPALKLIPLILQGVGHFLHYFLFFYEHIFLSLSLSCTFFFSPLHMQVSCFIADFVFGFSNVNTHESACVEELPQPQRQSEDHEDLWSDGTFRVQT